jgi:hypothetical protein
MLDLFIYSISKIFEHHEIENLGISFDYFKPYYKDINSVWLIPVQSNLQ